MIVYSRDVGCLKPDARIDHLVCGRLEVEPEQAVLVDAFKPMWMELGRSYERDQVCQQRPSDRGPRRVSGCPLTGAVRFDR